MNSKEIYSECHERALMWYGTQMKALNNLECITDLEKKEFEKRAADGVTYWSKKWAEDAFLEKGAKK